MASNKTKRAIVVGPYRVHNFGDDLVGAIIAKHLQKAGYEVTVPRLGKLNAEWLGMKHADTYDGAFKGTDTVVIGGGGIMSDTSGAKPGASYLDIVAKAAMAGDLAGKRVFVTSVGAGPWILERSKMLAFGVSLIADKIGVRDQESFDHLASIGVSGDKVVLGADCALLSADYLDFKAKPSGKIGLQFNTGQFRHVQKNSGLSQIIDAVNQYAAANSDGVTIVSNTYSKSPISEAAPEAETLNYTNLEDYLPRLAGLKSIFTSHLHLAITSYSQRIPTFSLYVREKTKRFYDQTGHPERCIDLSVATLDDFKRFMDAAEAAIWTDEDENTLQRLQKEARSLLAFVD